MMRPTMEQLIDFVRDGESDPKIADMLKFDPDANAKLLEARFIYSMIGEQSTPDMDESEVADVADLNNVFNMEVAGLEMESPHSPERSALRLAEPPDGNYQVPDIARSVRIAGPPGDDLGTVLAVEGEEVLELSHRPPKGAENEEPAVPTAESQEITIDWPPVRIRLARSHASDRPLKVRITTAEDDTPIEGAEVVYMAISGPFSRSQTNKRGVAKLAPIRDGVLRISAKHIGLLRVEKKISADS